VGPTSGITPGSDPDRRSILAHPLLPDLAVAALLAAMVVVFGRVYSGFVQDDAYITYRYARNLAAGAGFVYNAGAPVLGTSTPLYTLVLALLAKLTGASVERVGIVLWLLSLWTAAVSLYVAGRPAGRPTAVFTALVFVTSPFLRHMVGMEAAFLLALVLLSTLAFSRGRYFLTSVLLGALILTRYEMALYAVVLGTYAWFRLRRNPTWLLPAFGIVSVWMVYAAIRFGSPIPTSFSAKLTTIRIPFLAGLLFYWQAFARETVFYAAHLFLMLTGLVAIIVRRRIHLEFTLLLLLSAAYLVAVIPIAGAFPWYYAPLLPSIAICIVRGARYLARAPEAPRGSAEAIARGGAVRGVVAGLLLAGVVLTNLTFFLADWRDFRGGNWDHRFVAFTEASDWLRSRLAPGDTVALGEIGYIGYLTDAEVIDLSGLVTPGVHPWLGPGLEFTTARAIDAYHPRFLLLDAGRVQVGAIDLSPRYALAAVFEDRYQLFERTPGSE
jgi:arabinofuranosyltransferase